MTEVREQKTDDRGRRSECRRLRSKYPTAILILGWISIVAAAVLGIMGRTNFKRLMSWALNVAPSFGRLGGLLAILFGGFLIMKRGQVCS